MNWIPPEPRIAPSPGSGPGERGLSKHGLPRRLAHRPTIVIRRARLNLTNLDALLVLREMLIHRRHEFLLIDDVHRDALRELRLVRQHALRDVKLLLDLRD